MYWIAAFKAQLDLDTTQSRGSKPSDRIVTEARIRERATAEREFHPYYHPVSRFMYVFTYSLT